MSQLDDYPECLADFKTYHERREAEFIDELEFLRDDEFDHVDDMRHYLTLIIAKYKRIEK